MEHTKEPWRIEPATKKDNWRIVASNGQVVSTFSGNMDMDNARRIVAAVNACRDIETEVLEMETGSTALFGRIAGKLTSENMRLRDSVSDVTAHRDELLAVLEAILEEVAGCYCTTEAEARAVIQKVRGGE